MLPNSVAKNVELDRWHWCCYIPGWGSRERRCTKAHYQSLYSPPGLHSCPDFSKELRCWQTYVFSAVSTLISKLLIKTDQCYKLIKVESTKVNDKYIYLHSWRCVICPQGLVLPVLQKQQLVRQSYDFQQLLHGCNCVQSASENCKMLALHFYATPNAAWLLHSAAISVINLGHAM